MLGNWKAACNLRAFSAAIHKFIFPTSLKRKLIVILLLSSTIPLLLVGVISYYSLHTFIEKRQETGIRKNLERTRLELENTLNNLNYASGPLALNNDVGRKIYTFLHSDNIIEKLRLKDEMSNNILSVNFTNQNLGVMFYYLSDNKTTLFENQRVSDKIDVGSLPRLSGRSVQFKGPHKTSYANGNFEVFSILRKVPDPSVNCYIYIETNYGLLEQLLSKSQYGIDVSFLLVNDEGNIVYSEPDLAHSFPVGHSYKSTRAMDSKLNGNNSQPSYVRNDGFYLFEEPSDQGWRIVAAIQESTYNKEIYNWLLKFSALCVFSIGLSLIFAWVLWRTVYRPIRNLGAEFKLMAESQFKPGSPIRQTRVTEFDRLLDQFYEMKGKVAELIVQNEQKERDKRNLEIEKLVSQINPHFLYNTLNTVQWLARAKGNDDVVRLVAILIRLLHYNLGKNGPIVKMGKELEALQDYVELQRIRYDYDFDVQIAADPNVFDVLVPRFLLQPLVENALYHGLGDEKGTIRVRVERGISVDDDRSFVLITIRDNGVGMTTEQIDRLFRENIAERDKVGLGIGLQYVRKTLEAYYGNDVSFEVESRPKEGTMIQIQFVDKLMEE